MIAGHKVDDGQTREEAFVKKMDPGFNNLALICQMCQLPIFDLHKFPGHNFWVLLVVQIYHIFEPPTWGTYICPPDTPS